MSTPEETNTRIYEDPRYTRLYIAWRHRYNQARNILEKACKRVRTLSELYPTLFDSGTPEGLERRENVLQMLDEGNYESVKEFCDHWQSILNEARRDELLKQATALENNPKRKAEEKAL